MIVDEMSTGKCETLTELTKFSSIYRFVACLYCLWDGVFCMIG